MKVYFPPQLLGKKARTFDLEAMFEQTRRTAVERSRKMLGKIGESPVLVLFFFDKKLKHNNLKHIFNTCCLHESVKSCWRTCFKNTPFILM